MLTTGLHTVCDVFCIGCDTNVGWYYIRGKVLGLAIRVVDLFAIGVVQLALRFMFFVAFLAHVPTFLLFVYHSFRS